MANGSAYARALAELTAGLQSLGLPRERVCMLHVRLRGVHERTGLAYADCTRLVLEAVGAFAPRAVLVPAFTYSFTKSGIFHRLFSRSEAGRFSEEVRLQYAKYRTPDPLFSVLDTTDWLEGQTGLRFDGAFEPGCIWERLLAEDAVILNLGIKTMVATQVHYLERLKEAPWRVHVTVSGVVYADETRFRRVDYDFFARDLEQNRLLDWPGIRRALEGAGSLHAGQTLETSLAWMTCRDLHSLLGGCMVEDPEFLVAPLGREPRLSAAMERRPTHQGDRERQ